MKVALRVACLAALLAPAMAFGEEAGRLLVATDARAIVDQQQEIRAEAMARTGRYKDMDEHTRADLFTRQDQVLELLEGRERSTELSQRDRNTLFNALESIEAIVNDAEDERMICRRERATGSHRVANVCKTVAQIRAEREQSQTVIGLRDNQCEKCGEGDSTRPEAW